MYLPDTIVAPATAPGLGAVAIVRLSGPRAFEILDAIFRPAHSAEFTPRMMRLGDVVDPATGARIDRALAFVMPQPASLTGEDVAEIQCHGGPFVVRRIIGIALDAGARLAEPGEFTRRAFLNGRMDLTEAEAVADIVAARSDSALANALSQLSGALSERVAELRAQVIAIRAHLEVEIDFSDEDIRLPSRREVAAEIERLIADVAVLHDSFARGLLMRDGVRATIIGKPNAGKSSLLNLLLGADRAIVTAIAGHHSRRNRGLGPARPVRARTQRHRGRARIDRRRRENRNRAHAAIGPRRGPADRDVRFVAPTRLRGSRRDPSDSRPPRTRDPEQARSARGNHGFDRSPRARPADSDPPVLSNRSRRSCYPACRAHESDRRAHRPSVPTSNDQIAISRERHRDALAMALGALKNARSSALSLMPPEIVAVDIMAAASALGSITGEVERRGRARRNLPRLLHRQMIDRQRRE